MEAARKLRFEKDQKLMGLYMRPRLRIHKDSSDSNRGSGLGLRVE